MSALSVENSNSLGVGNRVFKKEERSITRKEERDRIRDASLNDDGRMPRRVAYLIDLLRTLLCEVTLHQRIAHSDFCIILRGTEYPRRVF